jgi:hypothetical protein
MLIFCAFGNWLVSCREEMKTTSLIGRIFSWNFDLWVMPVGPGPKFNLFGWRNKAQNSNSSGKLWGSLQKPNLRLNQYVQSVLSTTAIVWVIGTITFARVSGPGFCRVTLCLSESKLEKFGFLPLIWIAWIQIMVSWTFRIHLLQFTNFTSSAHTSPSRDTTKVVTGWSLITVILKRPNFPCASFISTFNLKPITGIEIIRSVRYPSSKKFPNYRDNNIILVVVNYIRA